MEDKEITLVGYWNGDETKPHITFETPTEQDSEYRLVVIKVLQPFEKEDRLDAVSINEQVKSIEKISTSVMNKHAKKMKDVSSNLNKLSKIMKRFR